MTPQEIYTLASCILLLFVAMKWSDVSLLDVVFKLTFYVTGTVGLVFTILRFIPAAV